MKDSEEQWITSVGIDIGTSTTKLIVSRLKLARTSGALALPRFDIVERELLYSSPIHRTPLSGADEIDAARISALLAGEYERAGISVRDLKSGAVIITGETANKRNARQIVHLLAERSGDFVVAAAGADLEGLLAGRGAGAQERSRRIRGPVVNVDIGGGTANAAVFLRGKPIGTATFHAGGRLLELDRSGTLTAVSESIRPWLRAAGYRLSPGGRISYEALYGICQAMCRDMLSGLTGTVKPERREAVGRLTLGRPMASVPLIEEWTVSGGIGRLMQEPRPRNLAETAVHGDIGPLLAHALKDCFAREGLTLKQPDETVRATVIGAGMQSTELSGATVHLDASVLPIRNLPVIKAELPPEEAGRPQRLGEAAAKAIRTAASLFEPDVSDPGPPFALAVPPAKHWSYASLQRLSEQVCEAYRSAYPASRVLVVVCADDMAKALGQSLSLRCGSGMKIVCIDQITVEYGDYIDLGEPIGGMMIPAVVKTLAFHGSEGR
ncbi:ethanolamine ammonia-lyase reactivating factor EutA [Paenibacillus doosanensis]|uniref:ethanolamine ammonia-lyase reactivating factor EutA n=1 Tax=Paenibacillus doosanensis TaxID=1229154 RepID=UPI002180014A|nr:ethanolamine ammonia-lyase reactivating factor EutA [Paenibacillus doosanensis]MCS7464603.1 ethanolamine ammonia-lyase reactivating factor EutA [Paenibacillus doosanensis]